MDASSCLLSLSSSPLLYKWASKSPTKSIGSVGSPNFVLRQLAFVPAGFRHLFNFGELTLLDGHGGEGAVEIAGLLVGEGRLLNVDLGAVDLGIGVGGHGWLKRYKSSWVAGLEKMKRDCVRPACVASIGLHVAPGLANVL